MNKKSDTRSRRKFGRPPKPRDEVRSERVVSFVTRGELDALNDIAADCGESLSSVVHRFLRTALVKYNLENPRSPFNHENKRQSRKESR